MERIFKVAAEISEFSLNLKAWKLAVVGIECDDTHFNVISRACKVTVVGIECNGAAFLTSFQEGPHQELFFHGLFQTSASKMTYSRYCQLSYVVTSKLLATHFLNFYFLSLNYGVRMRKKNTQESEDEWWARLDKRIERVRAKLSSLALEWEPFF